MIIALIDNGSLEAASHLRLRALASALSDHTDASVHAVSWKHSDRVPAASLGGKPGETLAPFVRRHAAAGERSFLFVPFFISPQGAIGSALRSDLETLQQENAETPFAFTFTPGLADAGVIAQIVAARVRETISVASLDPPPVLVVDHGGPSPASAALRNRLAGDVRALLGSAVLSVTAASMEGGAHAHNHPLLAEALAALSAHTASPPPAHTDVVVALLLTG